jgi:hypothetical protein
MLTVDGVCVGNGRTDCKHEPSAIAPLPIEGKRPLPQITRPTAPLSQKLHQPQWKMASKPFSFLFSYSSIDGDAEIAAC